MTGAKPASSSARALWLALAGLALLAATLALAVGLAAPATACDAEASRTSNGDPYLPQGFDPDKMAAIEEAARIADVGQLVARETLARAFTENIYEADVVRAIDAAMVAAGADEPSFATIVASGEDSAIPHGDPNNDETNQILPGEVVVVDVGARVDAWASDETRTYVLEPVPENFTQVYTVVHEAQELAIAEVENGKQAWLIDKAARDHIIAAGYGSNFIHSLGHGVGLCVHERPLLAQRNGSSWGIDYDANRDITSVADVVTVEPGIYLPGVWGVRIEDDFRVLSGGSERYTHTPTDFDWVIIRANETNATEPEMPPPVFSDLPAPGAAGVVAALAVAALAGRWRGRSLR